MRHNVTPLSLYVVSHEKIPDGRFIDTADLPKLGYIGATPDLVISQLEYVSLESRQSGLALDITMRPEDAKTFEVLTEQNVGKRVLLMLGNEPLMAPVVQAPIPTQSLILTLGKGTDSKKVQDELEKLVR